MSRYADLLAKKVSNLLHESGLSQQEFAEKTGQSQQVISRLINGKIENPTLQTLISIAEPFKRSLAWLLSEEAESQKSLTEIAREAAREAIQEAMIAREIPELSPLARTVAASLATLDESELADVSDFIETVIRNRSTEPSSKSKKLR